MQVYFLSVSVFQVLLEIQEVFKPTENQYSGHGKGLMSSSEESWDQRHRLRFEADKTNMDHSSSWKPTLCFALGFCVCEGVGKQALFFHQNIISLLKPFVKARRQKKSEMTQEELLRPKAKTKSEKPKSRILMETGFLVMHLHTDDLDTAHANAESKSDDEESVSCQWLAFAASRSQPIDSTREAKSHFLHISYTNYQTWHFSVTPLLPADDIAIREGNLEIQVRVPDPMAFQMSIPFFAKHIALEKSWRMTLYQLQSTSASVPQCEMSPNEFKITKHDAVPKMQIWKGSAAEAENRKNHADKSEAASKRQRRGGNTAAGHKDHTERTVKTLSLRPASKQKARAAVLNQPQFAEIEDHPIENPFLLDDVGGSGSELDEDTDQQEDRIIAWLDDFPNESIDDVPEFHGSGLPSSSSGVQQPSSSSSGAQQPASSSQAQALVSETAAPAHPTDTVSVSKPRTFTEKSIEIPGVGEIHMYPNSNNMVAFCRRHTSDCRKSKTLKPSSTNPSQGRPIGYLTAWLLDGRNHDSSVSHKSLFTPSHQERLEGRRVFQSAPGSDAFARFERPQADGEPIEPRIFR